MPLPVRPALAAVVLACLAYGPVLAAEGDPDSTFWTAGKVLFAGSGSYLAHGLVTAPDGRLGGGGAFSSTDWFLRRTGPP